MNTELAKFLAADERPQGTLILPELYGFLYAVACSPEVLLSPEWMPMVFNNEDAGFENEAQAQAITQAIKDVYREVEEQADSAAPSLPQWCEILEPPMENFGDEAPLHYWSLGFTLGHDWLSDVWDNYLSNANGELGGYLLTLSFFATKELAETYWQELIQDESVSFEGFAEAMVDNFGEALAGYSAASAPARGATQSNPIETFVRDADKVGRNDPCPCGSGKKYKKCCMNA